MGNQVVAQNQQNVSVRIRILDDSDGTPANSIVESTTGLEIWYQRDGSEDVGAISPTVTDFSALTTAHLDWAFAPIRRGYYRVDMPDAAFLEGSFGATSSFLMVQVMSSPSSSVTFPPSATGHLSSPVMDVKV